MKKAEAQIKIEINITCPHCREYCDLLDEAIFPSLNEEGYLIENALGDNFGCKDFNETIQCPECKKSFVVSHIWW